MGRICQMYARIRARNSLISLPRLDEMLEHFLGKKGAEAVLQILNFKVCIVTIYVSVWINFFWLIHNSNKYLEKDYAKASQVSCILKFFVIYESIA
ncbi:hypothetical protein C0J52_22431 [Blattella germanica]|nr:hypothetical protein C0J52_22431 [Blattella germanica]